MNYHRHNPKPTGRRITATFSKANWPPEQTVISRGQELICSCGERFILHSEDLPAGLTPVQLTDDPRWLRQTPPRRKPPRTGGSYTPCVKGLTKKQLQKSLNKKFAQRNAHT